MTGNLRRIPVPDPDEEPEASPMVAPALGYSILANLGDEKQLTVQCFVDSEEALPSIHAKIDKAMAVIDRQKAIYRKRDLAREVEKMERTLRQLNEDLARLEGDFEASQKALDDRISANIARLSEIQEAAYGRGRAQPQGADGAQMKALKAENQNLVEQKDKAGAERQQARGNIATSIVRYNEEIEKAKEQIAECEALIDGGV